MNKGPDIYSSDDLRVEYSRQERHEMTRFPGGRQKRAGRRYSMRILLLDLLLLFIIGGIIYPFILNRNSTGTLEGVVCALTVRTVGEAILISVGMRNSAADTGQKPFDLTIYTDGDMRQSLSDITPPPGEERFFRFNTQAHEKKISIRAVVEIGGKKLNLNTAVNPVR